MYLAGKFRTSVSFSPPPRAMFSGIADIFSGVAELECSSLVNTHSVEEKGKHSLKFDCLKTPSGTFVLCFDLPGVHLDAVSVTVTPQNDLLVVAKRTFPTVGDLPWPVSSGDGAAGGLSWTVHERKMGQLSRKIKLPKNADVNQIKTTLHQGQLFVAISSGPPPAPLVPVSIAVSEKAS